MSRRIGKLQSNPISNEEVSRPSTLVEKSAKFFHRKQDGKNRFNGLKKKKSKEIQKQEQICFMKSSSPPLQINRILRSQSNAPIEAQKIALIPPKGRKARMSSPESQRDSILQSSSRIRSIQIKDTIKIDSKKNNHENASEEKRLREEMKKYRRDVQELTGEKYLLNKEVKSLKAQLQSQQKKIQHMNDRVKMLNEAIKENRKKFVKKNEQIQKLQLQNQQQRVRILKLEQTVKKKEKELKMLQNDKSQKEELERAISEMNQNFQEMFIESKMHEYESGVNSCFSDEIDFKRDQIFHLQEKIKYQQIEINMLKRYRYVSEKYDHEIQKLRSQNQLLLSRIKTMSQFRNQIPFQRGSSKYFEDFSLSFELSKD